MTQTTIPRSEASNPGNVIDLCERRRARLEALHEDRESLEEPFAELYRLCAESRALLEPIGHTAKQRGAS